MSIGGDFTRFTQETDPIPPSLEGEPRGIGKIPSLHRADFLPLGDLNWQDFERLCLRLGREVHSLTDARLYGNAGQKQRGIDIAGVLKDGSTIVYQARDIQLLKAKPLEDAVGEFARERPLGSSHFVFCVTATARATDVVDKYHELAKKHRTNFEFELWDNEQLSDLLRPRPHLVEKFFNPHWAALFCEPAATPPHRGSEFHRDIIQGGPLEALGLEDAFATAEEMADADPLAAAQRIEAIADTVAGGAYAPYSTRLVERAAVLYEAAGRREQAFDLLFRTAVKRLRRGDFSSLNYERKLVELLPPNDRLRGARLHATQICHYWFTDGVLDVAALLPEMLTLLNSRDEFAEEIMCWAGELALAEADHDAEQQLLQFSTEHMTFEQQSSTRYRSTIADLAGRWRELLDDLAGGGPRRRDLALARSRNARSLAWQAQGTASRDAYRAVALDWIDAGLLGDAAVSLRSGDRVSEWLAFDPDRFGEGRNVASGFDSGPRLRARSSLSRMEALEALANESVRTAAQRARAYLYDSVVSGMFVEEVEARSLLGRVLADNGSETAALTQLILAGDTAGAKSAASRLENPFSVVPYLQHPAPWVRAAAFAATSGQARLLVGPDAPQITSLCLTELESTQGVEGLSPDPLQSAAEALLELTPEIGADALDRAALLAIRAISGTLPLPGYVRIRLARFAVRLYACHPTARAGVQAAIVAGLKQPAIGQEIVREVVAVGDLVGDLQPALQPEATPDNPNTQKCAAALGLAYEGLAEEAERLALRVLSHTAPEDGHYTIGVDFGLVPQHAKALAYTRLVQVADKLTEIARDERELELTRASALHTLTNIAKELHTTERSRLLVLLGPMLDGTIGLSEADRLHRKTNTPLSAARIDFGAGSLFPAIVVACAALATDAADVARVCAVITTLLFSDSDAELDGATTAIQFLDDRGAILPIRVLANHRSPGVRALAVLLALKDKDDSWTELAGPWSQDASDRVRLTLARNLPSDAFNRVPHLRGLLTDRHPWVRFLARRATTSP